MTSARRRLIVVAVLAGCGGAERVPSGGGGGVSAIPRPAAAEITVDAGVPDAAPAPPQIEVYYWPDDDQWEVTWRFAEPTTGIVFERQATRADSWQEGDGLVWRVPPTSPEMLVTSDGSKRHEFSATFVTHYDGGAHGAPQNVVFGDGGRLLYTGRLGAYAMECETRPCTVRDPHGSRVWRVTSDESYDRVRVGRSVAAGTLEWVEPAGERYGTFFYVGRGIPVEVGGATILFDDTLPPWFARDAAARLPEIFTFYRERTGITLDELPLMYAAYDAGRPGSWRRGRTLPSAISLELGGGDWKRATADNRARWFEFLAHEVFHAWTGVHAGRNPREERWFVEGSATYAAMLAREHAGMLGASPFARRLLDDANQCLATLYVGLAEAAPGPYHYTCGELVFFLLDRRLAADGGVFGLLADTQAFTSEDFLALLAARTGADDPLLADLQQLLDYGLGDDPAAFMVRILERAGLATAKVRGRAGAAPRLRLRTARLLGRPAGGARR